jgi:DNA-binding CsgD family transcriptional regulator
MYVSLATLRRATQLIDGLGDPDQIENPAELILAGVADLVGCDIATYNEIGFLPDHLGYYAEYPLGSLDPASITVFQEHLHEHPLLANYRAPSTTDPARISDFLNRQQFHRLGIYSEFFRHIPVEHQIAFSMPGSTKDRLVAIALNRAGPDFTDADAALLSVLQAPLGNALRRWRARGGASTALARADSYGGSDLTGREVQVLQFAAAGRTNQAIATAIDVSPRTIAKHLENIYRKLGVTSRAAAVYAVAGGADQRAASLPGGSHAGPGAALRPSNGAPPVYMIRVNCPQHVRDIDPDHEKAYLAGRSEDPARRSRNAHHNGDGQGPKQRVNSRRARRRVKAIKRGGPASAAASAGSPGGEVRRCRCGRRPRPGR